MQPLKNLLLYDERLSEEFRVGVSAKDYCGLLSDDDAQMALRYMEGGLVLWEFVSPTIDPLGSGDDVRNVVVTDGVFVWDGLLRFWVSRYRIALPREFLEHVRTAGVADVESLAAQQAQLMDAFKVALPVVMSSDYSGD